MQRSFSNTGAIPPSTAGRRLFGRRLSLGIGMTCVLLPQRHVKAIQPFRVGGTGSALAIMEMLADAYRLVAPAATIEILPSLGSSGGLRALGAGVVQIAVSVRPLTEAERNGQRDLLFARTPLVFAAHTGNGIDAISRRDLIRVYAGDMTEWPSGVPVRLIRRPATEADWAALASLSPDMARAVQAAQRRPGLITAATDQDNASALESVRGSFGLISLGQALAEKRTLSLLTLDGVAPSLATMASGEWQLTRDLYVMTKTAAPPEVVAFFEFLSGAESRQLLAQYGYAATSGAPR
ncbi:PstS family phosphate ABC transporter substrate-binding protein [Roseomonas sp. F4]